MVLVGRAVVAVSCLLAMQSPLLVSASTPDRPSPRDTVLADTLIIYPERSPRWLRGYQLRIGSREARPCHVTLGRNERVVETAAREALARLVARPNRTYLGHLLSVDGGDTLEVSQLPAFTSKQEYVVSPASSDTMTYIAIYRDTALARGKRLSAHARCEVTYGPGQFLSDADMETNAPPPPADADSAMLADLDLNPYWTVPTGITLRIEVEVDSTRFSQSGITAALTRLILASLAPLERGLRSIYTFHELTELAPTNDVWRFADGAMRGSTSPP
jgi:hypothetical protein